MTSNAGARRSRGFRWIRFDGRHDAAGQRQCCAARRWTTSTYMVQIGNYVGQNFGLITRIDETEVQLKEIVQDAAGEWVERPARLELQEGTARSQASKR
ncbi:MAG: pilus assembly protein PilP [Vicinamibacterales bacterium]